MAARVDGRGPRIADRWLRRRAHLPLRHMASVWAQLTGAVLDGSRRLAVDVNDVLVGASATTS